MPAKQLRSFLPQGKTAISPPKHEPCTLHGRCHHGPASELASGGTVSLAVLGDGVSRPKRFTTIATLVLELSLAIASQDPKA